MKNPFIQFIKYTMLGVILLSPVFVQADDTDIYVSNALSATSEPMVMFVLDWRPNLGSIKCNGLPTVPALDPTNATDRQTVATACGWSDPNFVSYFTAADLSDGKVVYFELLRAALKQVLEPLSGVKIGLMMSHDNNCSGNNTCGPTVNSCSNGAYILSGFKSIDATDANGNKAAFHTILSNIPIPGGNESHKYQGKEIYFELFRYLSGQGIYNGHLGYKDFGNTNATNNLNGTPTAESPPHSNIAWDTSIESGTDYVTPIAATADCVKVFTINLMDQVSQQDDDSNSAISATKSNGGMNSLLLQGNTNNLNTVLAWLHNNDIANGTYGTAPDVNGVQNVTSYFVVDSPNNTTNGYANAGGTGTAITLGSDPASMVANLKSIFNQILSVSTTFVAASVPVNVFNRTEFLDDVYIALFQAEKNGKPQWVGNLKKLKIQLDANNNYFIGDANGIPAFASDSRINYNALSFWTNPAGADVVAANTTDGEITGLDGRSVARGGAGQRINGFLSGSPGINNADAGARQLFTEPGTYVNGTPTTLVALDATAANAGTFWSDLNANGVYSSGTTFNTVAWSTALTYAAATAAEQTIAINTLKCSRGIDVNDQNGNGSTTDTRPWLLGDPIHSRPLAINYGATTGYSTTNPDIRIIMGGNDGYIHMFRNTTTSGAQSGAEVWGFMPRWTLNIQKRLMDNAPGSPLHPYGVDGESTVYTYDANKDGSIKAADGDKAYLFFGLRRGGRHYYALDVTTPDSPKMLWHISNSTAGFSEIGLTFSTPKVIKVSYDSNVKVPALVFAGGYDTNKDTRNNSPGSDDGMGRGVFIVNAATGALIWKGVYGASSANISATEYNHSEMVDSIASEVTPMDSDADGVTDRLYVGDTGGRIWRIDMAGTNRTTWKVTKFASVGHHANNSKSNDRRVFHAVDVVQSRDSVGSFDAIIGGTGDRPNPLDKSIGNNIPENWFFMIKDRNTTSGTPPAGLIVFNNLADLSDNCFQQVGATCTATQINNLSSAGWKILLNQATGEKALSAPVTLAGAIYFTSYEPPQTTNSVTCGPSEGSGLLYCLNLQDASAKCNFDLSNAVTNANGDVIEMQASDRFRYTGTGIPADVIVISKGGKNIIVPPGGLMPVEVKTRWRTFWYQRKD